MLSIPYSIRKIGDRSILSKLKIHVPHNDDWATKHLAPDIFKQKFSYLAQGYQSAVFVSEDHQYVLKLFFKGDSIHPWRHVIRKHLLHLREKMYGYDRVHQQMIGATIASNLASDLTGVVYAHLNQSHETLPTIKCIDFFGRTLAIPLDTCRFIVQRKGVSFEDAYSQAIQQNDLPKFERLTHSFAKLLKTRISRGIRNKDVAVEKNFGFIGETAIEWDFGQYECIQFSLDELNEELASFLYTAESYFKKNHPQWASRFKSMASKD